MVRTKNQEKSVLQADGSLNAAHVLTNPDKTGEYHWPLVAQNSDFINSMDEFETQVGEQYIVERQLGAYTDFFIHPAWIKKGRGQSNNRLFIIRKGSRIKVVHHIRSRTQNRQGYEAVSAIILDTESLQWGETEYVLWVRHGGVSKIRPFKEDQDGVLNVFVLVEGTKDPVNFLSDEFAIPTDRNKDKATREEIKESLTSEQKRIRLFRRFRYQECEAGTLDLVFLDGIEKYDKSILPGEVTRFVYGRYIDRKIGNNQTEKWIALRVSRKNGEVKEVSVPLRKKLFKSRYFSGCLYKGFDDYRTSLGNQGILLHNTFVWNGDNHRNERREAGVSLLMGINGLIENKNFSKNRYIQFHFIAHSHGGNVTIEALRLLTGNSVASHRWPSKWKVKSVTFLSTPFQSQNHPYDFFGKTQRFLHRNFQVINVRSSFDLTQQFLAAYNVRSISETSVKSLQDLDFKPDEKLEKSLDSLFPTQLFNSRLQLQFLNEAIKFSEKIHQGVVKAITIAESFGPISSLVSLADRLLQGVIKNLLYLRDHKDDFEGYNFYKGLVMCLEPVVSFITVLLNTRPFVSTDPQFSNLKFFKDIFESHHGENSLDPMDVGMFTLEKIINRVVRDLLGNKLDNFTPTTTEPVDFVRNRLGSYGYHDFDIKQLDDFMTDPVKAGERAENEILNYLASFRETNIRIQQVLEEQGWEEGSDEVVQLVHRKISEIAFGSIPVALFKKIMKYTFIAQSVISTNSEPQRMLERLARTMQQFLNETVDSKYHYYLGQRRGTFIYSSQVKDDFDEFDALSGSDSFFEKGATASFLTGSHSASHTKVTSAGYPPIERFWRLSLQD